MNPEMEGWPRCTVPQVDVPPGRSGLWSVQRYEVEPAGAFGFNMREALQGTYRFVTLGPHTKLIQHHPSGDPAQGVVYMSDTIAERRDHEPFVAIARGHVLVTGLGLGVVLPPLFAKPEVRTVTVVERQREVFSLVAPHYSDRYGSRLKLVHCDAYQWEPPPTVGFDCAWHDIWPDLTAANLQNYFRIIRHYRRHVRGPQLCWGWMEAWQHMDVESDRFERHTPGGGELAKRAAKRQGYHLSRGLIGHGPLEASDIIRFIVSESNDGEGGEDEQQEEGTAAPGEPGAGRRIDRAAGATG